MVINSYKQVATVAGVTTTTYYIGKHYEVQSSASGSKTVSYISDTALITRTDGVASVRFTHKDRLGSTTTFTDHNGYVSGYRSYDPFGKPKMGNGRNMLGYGKAPRHKNNVNDGQNVTTRGFTNHEHLDEVELIHMNGRAYDYNLGRFLSVDPFIQSPGDSQSINPYSYIMNNPLAGTDPTGYCAAATGTRIKSCGDMKVEVKVTMKDGSTATKSSVVKDVNFKNGADVSSAMSKGAAQAGGQFSAADFNSQGAIAKQSPTQSSGAGNSQSHTTSQTTDQVGMPIDSDVWEYVGQTNGVNTFQTVHKRPDDRVSIGDVNDNFVTPAGLIAGYVERKTNGSKRRWSDRYRNHGKIWDGARLVGNYAFVAGSLITAGTTISDIVDMRNSGRSVEDKVLRGIDGVADIGFGVAAFFGPVGWLAAATYYGADYLSGGNLTEFIYRGITGRREEEVSSSKQ